MATSNLAMRYRSLRQILIPIVRDQIGVTCIIGGQSAPRPALPYISFDFMNSLAEFGRPETRLQGTQETLVQNVEIQVQMNVFTDSESRYDNTDYAVSMAERVCRTLNLPVNTQAFSANNIAYISSGIIGTQSTILSTTYEPKASVFLKFSTVVQMDYDSGAIDTVKVGGNFKTVDGGIINTESTIESGD